MQVSKIEFECDDKRGLRDRLNIIAVAQAHVVWKNRLDHQLRGRSLVALSAAQFGQDGVCQLGHLIDGAEYAVFREVDAFWTLREAHHKFHQLAAAILDKLNEGDQAGAEILFETEYSLALHDMIGSLSAINRLLVA